MALNFNVDPYYDDFDPSKNFHRILFKPGYAVQARELTQAQTILQDQISKFANHIFSQNTPVTGGKVTTNRNCFFLKLNSTYNDVEIVASQWKNKIIQDSTGTVLARVLTTVEGTSTPTTVGDPPTLIISYLSGVKFADGMVITPTDGTNIFATTIGTLGSGEDSCTGYSSTASISEGVFYVVNGYSISNTENPDGTYSKYSIGNFVTVLPDTVVLEKYSRFPSVRVGLQINETIIDSVNDPSLLDPAISATNYQAPGADRYKVSLSLVALPLSIGGDDNFIELMRVDKGSIIKQVDETSYSDINNYIAKRDYETNGDYVVNDFRITANPIVSSNGANRYYNVKVGKGVAYVRGYRVENQSELTIPNYRARVVRPVKGSSLFVDYGGYFYVDTVKGIFDVTTFPQVDLHCVHSANIVSSNAKTYNSTLVGTGVIRNLQYVTDSGSSNTSTYVFKSYISDIVNNTLSSNCTSGSTTSNVQFFDTTSTFSVYDNSYVGATLKILSGSNQGVSKLILAYNAATKTAIVDSLFPIAPDANTTFSLILPLTTVDSVVQKTSTSNYSLKSKSEINVQYGKVNGIESGSAIYSDSGTPELIYNLGSTYIASVANTSYTTTKVFRDRTFSSVGGYNTITISMPAGSPLKFTGSGVLGSDSKKQLFTIVDQSSNNILDLSSSGNTITITSGTTATINSSSYSGKTVDIIVNDIQVSEGDLSTSYVLKLKNLTLGNTSVVSTAGPDGIINSNTYVDLTNGQVYIKNAIASYGQLSLYVSDVKRVVKIIDTLNSNTVPTVDMLNSSSYDITSNFIFNNGQKDSYYDHAYIQLKPGANKILGNLLVIFDFYKHSGGDGCFDINSYVSTNVTSKEDYMQIPTYTSSSGVVYNLRDCVDFRPTRKNGTSTFTFDYTGNPTSSQDDSGVLIPNNLTNYNYSYDFYLARKDKLIVTKDGIFKIINGTPDINPEYPVEPDGSLVLAEISHDPYTGYVPGEGPVNTRPNLSLNKILNRRWAKSDITKLEARVNNLEYYTSLSLLEQKAQSLQVKDENGLNRFKNGILVDDFSSYSTADINQSNYISNINIRTKKLSPVVDIKNFQLQNPIVLSGLGSITDATTYRIHGIHGSQTNIFTLPYTTTQLLAQPLASSVVNVNPFSVPTHEGILRLNPPIDNWIDSALRPTILSGQETFKVYQSDQQNQLTAVTAGDFATIPGTPLQQATDTNTTTNGLSVDNGYLINNNISPFIRQQKIAIKAKGLLVNSPIKTFFDGIDVSQYMTVPNTIEITNVTGTFNEDDVIGFYYSNKFNPIGKVLDTHYYPESTQTMPFGDVIYTKPSLRLYVILIPGYLYAPAGTKLQNAQYDVNGNYLSTTASADIVGSTVQDIHVSGSVSGVGGATYDINGVTQTNQVYAVKNLSNWSSFLNQHGTWGNITVSNGDVTTPYNASFNVPFSANGTYTFIASSTGSSITSIDGSVISGLNSANPSSTTVIGVNVTAGTHIISWVATNSSGPAAYALVVQDPNGNIVFDSVSPPGVVYDSVTKDYKFPGGGYWFSGVTKVKLDPNASNIDDYYTGSQISVTSTYVAATQSQTAATVYVAPPDVYVPTTVVGTVPTTPVCVYPPPPPYWPPVEPPVPTPTPPPGSPPTVIVEPPPPPPPPAPVEVVTSTPYSLGSYLQEVASGVANIKNNGGGSSANETAASRIARGTAIFVQNFVQNTGSAPTSEQLNKAIGAIQLQDSSYTGQENAMKNIGSVKFLTNDLGVSVKPGATNIPDIKIDKAAQTKDPAQALGVYLAKAGTSESQLIAQAQASPFQGVGTGLISNIPDTQRVITYSGDEVISTVINSPAVVVGGFVGSGKYGDIIYTKLDVVTETLPPPAPAPSISEWDDTYGFDR